jgi:hypothetical protein
VTPEAQRIAIAEEMPKHLIHVKAHVLEWMSPYGWIIFDPLRDLNAMHEAEKTLTREQQDEYVDRHLYPMLPCDENHGPCDLADGEDILIASSFQIAHATAAQRAEAFLRTIGKWVEK